MKKLVIALMAIWLAPTAGHALTPIGILCCIGNNYGNCENLKCTYNGLTRYFTNCRRCSDSSRTLEMNGPYEPCGPNAQVLDASYGECVQSLIVLPDKCAAGTYGKHGLCTLCPEPGTSAAASTVITDCYVPAGTGDTDTTGKWEYTADCHYSN